MDARKKRILLVMLALSVLGAMVLLPAAPVLAEDPPPDDGEEDGEDTAGLLERLIGALPGAFREALEGLLKDLVEQPVQFVEEVFSSTLGRWVTLTPGILTPSGAMGGLDNIMKPTWDVTVVLGVCLMPLTLAITAAIAAKDVVAARSWGIGDLRQAIFGWLLAAVAAGTSVHWMDIANRLANGMTRVILAAPLAGVTDVGNWAILTNVLLGGAVAAAFASPAGILLALIVFLIGAAILAGLIFSFYARFALLYVLVAIAPIVIVLGTMGPARWLERLWVKGFGMVLLTGPVTALLLKLAFIMAGSVPLSNPIDAIIRFICTAGVLSLVLMVTGQVVRFTFGAIMEVARKAVGTVMGLVAMAAAAVGAVVAGAGALGVGATAAGKAAEGVMARRAAGPAAAEPALASASAMQRGVSGLRASLAQRYRRLVGEGMRRLPAGQEASRRGPAEQIARGEALSMAGAILSAPRSTRGLGFALRGIGYELQRRGWRAARESGNLPPTPGQLARIRSLGAQVGRSNSEIEEMVAGIRTQAEANAAIARLEGLRPATNAQKAAIRDRAVQAGYSSAEALRLAGGVRTQSEAQQLIDSLAAGEAAGGTAAPQPEAPPTPWQLARIRSLGAQVGRSSSEIQEMVGGITTRSQAEAAIERLEGQLPPTRPQRERIEGLALGAGYSPRQARQLADSVHTRAEAQQTIAGFLGAQPGGGEVAGAGILPGVPPGAGSWAQRRGGGQVPPAPYTQGAPRVEDADTGLTPPVMTSGIAPSEEQGAIGPRSAPPQTGPGAGMPPPLGPVPRPVEYDPASPATAAMRARIRELGEQLGMPAQEIAAMLPEGLTQGQAVETVGRLENQLPATSQQRAMLERLSGSLGQVGRMGHVANPAALTRGEAAELIGRLRGLADGVGIQAEVEERLVAVSPGQAALPATAEQQRTIRALGEQLAGPGQAMVAAQASRGDLSFGEARELAEHLSSRLSQLGQLPAAAPAPPAAEPPVPQAPSVAPLSPEVERTLSMLDPALEGRARDLVLSQLPGARQQVADAIVRAVSRLEAQGHNAPEVVSAWDEGMAAVTRAAREGLALHTMAHDEGHTAPGGLADFIASRLEGSLSGGDVPRGHVYPWHSLPSAHDWEVGRELAALTGHPEDTRPWARLYHGVRDPKAGGWAAGQDLIRAVREIARSGGTLATELEGEAAARAQEMASELGEEALLAAVVAKLVELQESRIIPRKALLVWWRQMRRRRRPRR